jgi:hypothetical protein
VLIVSTPDADSLRKALAAAGPAWERDIVKAHREVGRVAAGEAQSQARSGTRAQRRAASGIQVRPNKKGVSIVPRSTASNPFAAATFMGAKKRTGWYAAERYRGKGKPQFPAWVGTNWTAGVRGQGPYVLNDAVTDAFPKILNVYGEQMDKVAAAIAARRVTSF